MRQCLEARSFFCRHLEIKIFHFRLVAGSLPPFPLPVCLFFRYIHPKEILQDLVQLREENQRRGQSKNQVLDSMIRYLLILKRGIKKSFLKKDGHSGTPGIVVRLPLQSATPPHWVISPMAVRAIPASARRRRTARRLPNRIQMMFWCAATFIQLLA